MELEAERILPRLQRAELGFEDLDVHRRHDVAAVGVDVGAKERRVADSIGDHALRKARELGAVCVPTPPNQKPIMLGPIRHIILTPARRDLFEAMKQVSETGRGPLEQMPSMGCSIKWRG